MKLISLFVTIFILSACGNTTSTSDQYNNIYVAQWNETIDKLNFADDKYQGAEVCYNLSMLKVIALNSSRDDLWSAYQKAKSNIKKRWECD